MDENPYQATVFERGPEGSLPDRVLWLGQWRRRMFWAAALSMAALLCSLAAVYWAYWLQLQGLHNEHRRTIAFAVGNAVVSAFAVCSAAVLAWLALAVTEWWSYSMAARHGGAENLLR
ncbi:MAG: hypothetical protein K1X71_04400 [Pirellulales bacterium]|nr:hypothetical protein [Pirellulales bacterium]